MTDLDSRPLVLATLTLLLLAALAAPAAIAEDGENLSSSVTIAAPDEPGERLRIIGTVYAPDGETPVAGAQLYVFHTDVDGYYSGTTTSNANPRLKARLRTDESGRYEIRTIRPGAYPGGGPPAHVHFVITADGYPEQRHELHFEGDPRLTESQATRSREAGRFGDVRPLEQDGDGVLRCVRDFRLRQ